MLLVASTPAWSADTAAARPVASFNWSGAYIGADAGGSFGNYTQFDGDGDGVKIDMSRFTGGVYAGYNWQINNFVLGLEADISNGPKGKTSQGQRGPAWICGTGDCNAAITYYGTVRARLAYAIDRTLVYGTGGFAYGRSEGGIYDSDQQGQGMNTGWTLGGGLEYAFTQHIVARAEYLHVDLGDIKFGEGIGGSRFRGRGSFDTIRLGIAYKF
jgi:outer membrane immunogenic protein